MHCRHYALQTERHGALFVNRQTPDGYRADTRRFLAAVRRQEDARLNCYELEQGKWNLSFLCGLFCV